MKIGSHVSFSDKGLLNAAQEAVGYGSSAFMVYTGAPQNTRRKPIEDQFVEEGQALMGQHGIEEVIVHAPYIINLGSYKGGIFELAVRFLKEEIERTAYLGVRQIVLHPGAFTDKDVEYGIARIAKGLNEVLEESHPDVQIALETMAGKGTEIGRSFDELGQIFAAVEQRDRLSVCLDTCHVHDAGYDLVEDLDGVLKEFDSKIGLHRLKVLHLNDSKNFRGAGKDRHAPVGSGLIGFDAIYQLVHHEKLKHLPMILETPWIGKDKHLQRPMYEVEIALLRGNLQERFGDYFIEDVDKLAGFYSERDMGRRNFVLEHWASLRETKGKDVDKREPLQRLYDMVQEVNLLEHRTEEEINQRIIAWLAGEQAWAGGGN